MEDQLAEPTRLSVARERLREVSPSPTPVRCPVADADGRALAGAVAADRAVPHYARAAMDGYAVRARDTAGADEHSPVRLARTDGPVGDRQAARVHTGSPLPEGADAVVMVERTEPLGADGDGDGSGDDARPETPDGSETGPGGVLVYDAVPEGDNVAPVGEDVEAGQRLFESGDVLGPSDLSLLHATGTTTVPVARPPAVSVLPTGEELVAAGEAPDVGEVVETNGLLVSTLTERWGGAPTYREVVTDDRVRLRDAIERDADHDVVVTTGGSSVGERDLVADVLDGLGTVLFHGVAIKPGHPVGAGLVDGTVVLMLPGYPVSCLITAVQLLRPLLAWARGTDPDPRPRTRGWLTDPIRSQPGTRTFARVGLDDGAAPTGRPDDTAVTPLRVSGAGVLSSVTDADGWVVVPEERGGIDAGASVAVEVWE